MKKYLKNIGVNSRIAFKNLNKVSFKKRNKIIDVYNKELGKNKNRIISENAKDLRNCKRQDLIDRLILDRNKILDRDVISGPFMAEMLTVLLIRGFTHDLVEHVGGSKLDKIYKKYLGIFEICKFQTSENIRQAFIVVFHHTTAIDEAIFLKKKIISLKSNALGEFMTNLTNYQQTFIESSFSKSHLN